MALTSVAVLQTRTVRLEPPASTIPVKTIIAAATVIVLLSILASLPTVTPLLINAFSVPLTANVQIPYSKNVIIRQDNVHVPELPSVQLILSVAEDFVSEKSEVLILAWLKKEKPRAMESPIQRPIRHPQIGVKIFKDYAGAIIPKYATELSSGFDLCACYSPESGVVALPMPSKWIGPGETLIVPTGLKFAIPPGYELQIRSRSGLASKNGIVVVNQPGTVDADFLGVVSLAIRNISQEKFLIEHGMRLAQGVICPVVQAQFQVVEKESDLGETNRGQGGFGSTGLK